MTSAGQLCTVGGEEPGGGFTESAAGARDGDDLHTMTFTR